MPRFPAAPKKSVLSRAAGRDDEQHDERSADAEQRAAGRFRVTREDLEGPYPGGRGAGRPSADPDENADAAPEGAGRHHASGVVRDQPHAVQPFADQPFAVQPHAVQPHAVQPNAVQPHAAQPHPGPQNPGRQTPDRQGPAQQHTEGRASEPGYPTQPGPGQRWSTWRSVAKGQRGPDPLPQWVVTRDAAIDTELGILKTGKEADAFLVERAVPAGADAWSDGGPDLALDQAATRCLLVAKRYRSLEHGQFHRGSEYTEGRTVRRTRDQRAMEDRKSAWGRAVSATQWADAEFIALRAAWSAGAPVPYPVQIDGTEVLMEFIGSEETDDLGRTQAVAAPRLTRVRPSDELLESYWGQLTHGMSVLARLGFAHGDLSPYNILAHGERLVIIDLPQVVDLAANPFSSDVLLRDCRTVCDWFTARGLDVDADALFADLLAQAF